MLEFRVNRGFAAGLTRCMVLVDGAYILPSANSTTKPSPALNQAVDTWMTCKASFDVAWPGHFAGVVPAAIVHAPRACCWLIAASSP
ncbi:hypothetical protein [Pseudomonas glycinae]|uniref:Uncharacterized protein n=1 Tax=Pseudomonas glycinae TaxID=1785145 RepID=A0ABM6QHF8_9PSED|nr:hypothetical protein [Pseudomonas glycinae]AUG97405.1 hypothetical protein AWU82_28390 [Pseudomonas glycinae]